MNHYEVLGIQRSELKLYALVSVLEIKQGYHASLLEHHPDKHYLSTPSTQIPIPTIKSAYAVLTDPNQRADYDRKLITGGIATNVPPRSTGCVVDLSEMDLHETDPDNFKWTRECRCGESEGYALTERDLELNGSNASSIVVQCLGCSLWIEVQYDIEE